MFLYLQRLLLVTLSIMITVQIGWGQGPQPRDGAVGGGDGEQTKIAKMQYKIGTGAYKDVNGTIFVKKDTTVSFQVLTPQGDTTFPDNPPVWKKNHAGTDTDLPPAGATNNVTFDTVSNAANDYYTITAKNPHDATNNVQANVVVFGIKLKKDGGDITDTNVFAGQLMNMSADTTPYTPTTFSWIIDGKINGGWEANHIHSLEKPADLSHQTVAFYWSTGGNKTVTFKVTVETGEDYTASVTFNAKRPDISVTSRTTYASFQDNLLKLGEIDVTEGIYHERSAIPAGFGTGTTIWVQRIPSYDYKYEATAAFNYLSCRSTLTTSALDTMDTVDYKYKPSTPDCATDSPDYGVGASVLYTYDTTSFETNLMYQPEGDQSIPIPISLVSWYWTAEGKIDKVAPTNSWSLDDFYNTNKFPTPTVTSTNCVDYPIWTGDSQSFPSGPAHYPQVDIIKGTVSGDVIAGVTISVPGRPSVTTGVDGTYSLPVGGGGPVTYTVTPSKPGFHFNPASQDVTVDWNIVSGINFTAITN